MVIEQINAPIVDDSEFWGPKYEINKKNCPKRSLFKLQQKLSNTLNLTYDDLKKHGLTSNLQSVISINGILLDYILNEIAGITLEASPEFLPKCGTYKEGSTMQVTINKYERNREAREKCIKVNGCYCNICGFNFEEIYGEVGKNFIHVHHLVPLSEIGESYIINPIEDLIPVCPNCHAMLHKKIDGKTIPVEKLKILLKNKTH